MTCLPRSMMPVGAILMSCIWVTPILAQEACPGDCNGDFVVTVDEVIAGVNIALGISPLAACPAFDRNADGSITVDEIIAAVDTALTGCAGTAIPTPSPTAPADASPTPAPTTAAEPSATATATHSPAPQTSPTPIGQIFGGDIRGLFPHGLGDEFVYQVHRSDGRSFLETRRVAANEPDGSFLVDTWEEGVLTRTESYLDTGHDLYEVGEVDHVDEVRTTCTPALLQMRTPLVVGGITEDGTRCDLRSVRGNRFLGQVQQVTRVIPVEILADVQLPAGRFENVVRIRAENTIGSSVENFDIWIAPGIGIIRTQESSFGQINRTAELVDGTVGGVAVRRP